jgi:hypothetical protein
MEAGHHGQIGIVKTNAELTFFDIEQVLVGGDEHGDFCQSGFRKDQAIVDFFIWEKAFAMKAQAKLLGYSMLNKSEVERLNFPPEKVGQCGRRKTPLLSGSVFR